jgi:hypothetical protein
MSCPTSYAFQKNKDGFGLENYYSINVLRIKIFDPENYENYSGGLCRRISETRYEIIEKQQTFNNIIEQMNRSIQNYSSGAVMTTSGQDMSYYHEQRRIHNEGCKTNALNALRKECIRIIENCKKVLTDYDMLEEFKKYNPSFANFFDFKECDITWEIANSRLDNFTTGTIMCALSHEADNKRREKRKKQNEIRLNKEKEEKELLYKKEFECMKLFDMIEKDKMKSSELYIEYKKIVELKEKYKPTALGIMKNTLFLDYFTIEKKLYLNKLLSTSTSQIKNQANETKKNISTNECVNLIISNTDNHIISNDCGCKRIMKKGINKGKTCNKKIYKKDLCMNHYINNT